MLAFPWRNEVEREMRKLVEVIMVLLIAHMLLLNAHHLHASFPSTQWGWQGNEKTKNLSTLVEENGKASCVVFYSLGTQCGKTTNIAKKLDSFGPPCMYRCGELVVWAHLSIHSTLIVHYVCTQPRGIDIIGLGIAISNVFRTSWPTCWTNWLVNLAHVVHDRMWLGT